MTYAYKVEAKGIGLVEYYEYDTNQSESEVIQDWLQDVQDRWGTGVSEAIKKRVSVQRLNEVPTEAKDDRDDGRLPPP